MALARLRRIYERLLETIVISLMLGLTTVVVVAVVYRKAGASLTWYDEVASILLAWLTYYGAALAAFKRAHIGFSGLVEALPLLWRRLLFWLAEIIVLGFFVLLAWVGLQVLEVLAGDTLVSLPWMPVRLTQSVIPIGAALFILGQLLSLPETHARVLAGGKLHDEDLPHVEGQR